MDQPETAIQINNLSKRYFITKGVDEGSLREKMTGIFGSRDNAAKKEFWALKDINLTIGRGDVVGLIGRNGAGKSTLLKVLSGIIAPTEGDFYINGRVTSLLEVGTGFHSELTGRENIYFNGSILGMKKREIDAKMQQIIDFSEIEEFIDTPVKFYSSGMYVRLAFSVAAHVDPDILIVDEALAVGDQAFQQKCLKRIREFTKEGNTVLFVSHSPDAVNSLCNRAVLLNHGQITMDAPTEEVLSTYLGKSVRKPGVYDGFEHNGGLQQVVVKKIALRGSVGAKRTKHIFAAEEPMVLDIDLDNKAGIPLRNLRVDVNIFNDDGTWIQSFTPKSPLKATDQNHLNVSVPSLTLGPGFYRGNVSLYTDSDQLQGWIDRAISFEVNDENHIVVTDALKTGFSRNLEISE